MISGVPAGKRPAALYGASATEPARFFLWGCWTVSVFGDDRF